MAILIPVDFQRYYGLLINHDSFVWQAIKNSNVTLIGKIHC
jgi:hypothetical protein